MRRVPRWHGPPPWRLFGVPCVRCGLPGLAWTPGVAVYHARRACSLQRAAAPVADDGGTA